MSIISDFTSSYKQVIDKTRVAVKTKYNQTPSMAADTARDFNEPFLGGKA